MSITGPTNLLRCPFAFRGLPAGVVPSLRRFVRRSPSTVRFIVHTHQAQLVARPRDYVHCWPSTFFTPFGARRWAPYNRWPSRFHRPSSTIPSPRLRPRLYRRTLFNRCRAFFIYRIGSLGNSWCWWYWSSTCRWRWCFSSFWRPKAPRADVHRSRPRIHTQPSGRSGSKHTRHARPILHSSINVSGVPSSVRRFLRARSCPTIVAEYRVRSPAPSPN